MMLLAVAFEETINLGAILIVICGMAMALLFTVRSRSSATWKDNYEAAEARNRDLLADIERQREEKHTALSEAAALKMTRDISPVLEKMQEVIARIVAIQEEGELRYGGALAEVRTMFADHEKRAQDRHDAQLKVLEAIANKMNGGS